MDQDARWAALSALVLQLHKGSRDWPAALFRPRACELLSELLQFDAALWSTEMPKGAGLVTPQVFGVSDTVLADYLADTGLAQGATDPLRDQARQQPGRVVVAAARAGAMHPALLRAGAEHVLCILGVEALTGMGSCLQVWRHAAALPFDELEQQMLAFVMPHLVEASRESQLKLEPDEADDSSAARSHAVCSHTGALLHIDERCLQLLRLEWPGWSARSLPPALVKAVVSGASPRLVGQRIVVSVVRTETTVMLVVRWRAPADSLSARQRDIAELYASGCTGPEIASQLQLAPSTVNNHLGAVFKKLQVGSKVQLVRALQGSLVSSRQSRS